MATTKQSVRERLAALLGAARQPVRVGSIELTELVQEARLLPTRFEGKSVTAREGCEVCVSYVASWMRHLDGSVDAIDLLLARNLSILTAPVQRLMIEHAVAAAMLAADPQSWEAFLRQSAEGAKKLKLQFESHSIEPPADLSNFIEIGLEEEQQPYKRYRQIRNRFESLGDDGRRFYLLWLEASQLSHAGAPTAVAYLRNTPGDDWPTVTEDAQIALDEMRIGFTSLDALLWCAESFSSMLIDDPLAEALAGLQRRKDELLEILQGKEGVAQI